MRPNHAIARRIGAVLTVAATAITAGCTAAVPETQPSVAASPDPVVTGTVWVANEADGSLTAIDAATDTVVTTVTGIGEPHNVQADAYGTRVYAVSGHTNTLVAVDAGTYRLASAAATGDGPAHVVQNPDGQKTYVTNFNAGTVSVYTGGDLRLHATVTVGGGPHGARPSPDGTTLVVANLKAATVDIIDTRTDTKTAAIAVGGPPVQIAVSPDNRYAYASVTQPPAVVKIDLRTATVTGRATVPAAPAQVYLTPDGSTVLSADQGSQDQPGTTITMIGTAGMTPGETVTTGSGPHGVVVDPSGRRAWITNVYDGTVSVIDLAARTVVATVKVGRSPNGISYSRRPPAPGAAHVALVVPQPSVSGSGEHVGHGHD
jgi:YVTN family beta-propeller protein